MKKKYLSIWFFVVYFAAVIMLCCRASYVLEVVQGSSKDYIFKGVIWGLQVFSLDAPYEDIIGQLFSDSTCLIICKYTAAIFAVAPVIGGAAILCVISAIFPNICFMLVKHFVSKIVVFSFLDERSYLIAQEMVDRGDIKWNACIVFANTWIEEGNEDAYNLVEKVRDFPVFSCCLKEDIPEIGIPLNKKADVIFAREDDYRNMDDALALIRQKERWLVKRKKRYCVYVYTQNEFSPEILDKTYEHINPKKSNSFDMSIMPYRTNAVYRAINSYPLFRVLGSPEKRKN